MMPVMDGLTTFARLREDSRVAAIPVVFMTARTQPGDVEKFRSLGATGVIAKPFDPLTLGDSVRRHLSARAAVLAELRASFVARARTDAAALLVRKHDKSNAALERIKDIAHGLAGAAGIYGFDRISMKAADLEDAVATMLAGEVASKDVEYSIDSLVASIVCMGGDQVQH
jgi:CheY-like chemotaxis protein